jgi:tetratricopeptide (TPR) repeat protein
MRRLPSPEPRHVIATSVAIGAVVLALVSTAAPAPREVYAIFSLAVWALAIAGVITGILPRAPIRQPAVLAGACLAGFTCLTALSVLWASDQGNAFDQVARVSGYAGLFVLVVLASRDGEGGAWLRGLAIGLTAIAAIALAPRLAPDLFGSPDADLDAQGRIGYPIRYWNGLAALMAASAAVLTWLAVQGRSRTERWLAFCALPLPILVLYMAQSRGGALASLTAFAVLLIAGPARQRLVANLTLIGILAVFLIGYVRLRTGFLERPGSELAADQAVGVAAALVAPVVVAGLVRRLLDAPLERLRLSRRAAIAGGVVAGVIALAAIVAIDPIERFEDFREPPTAEQLEADQEGSSLVTRSGGGRWQFWGTALDAFADEPLRGFGAGEFAYYWNHQGPFGFQLQNAHSLFLESLAELGILGFVLIVAFFGIVIGVGALRSQYLRDGGATVALALVAAGAVSAMFDFVWELPAVFAPVVIAAALLTGSALTPTLINAPPPPPEPLRRGARGLALAAVTLAFGWASIVASGLVVLNEVSLDRSRDAVTAQDYPEAINAAEDAADFEPWAAQPRVQLGLAYQRAGDFASARNAYREAIERADEDWRPWALLTIVEGILGDVDSACDSIERARELNPRQAQLYRRTELECPGPRPKPPPLVGS